MKKQTMGERVTELRKAYSLNQAAFAAKIKVAPLTVGNLERGVTQTFQQDTLEMIVKVFGTTKEWLENGTGKMLPHGLIKINESAPQTESWESRELWLLAKDQLEKKDKVIDRLAVSFDRLTDLMVKMEVNFLHPVGKTG